MAERRKDPDELFICFGYMQIMTVPEVFLVCHLMRINGLVKKVRNKRTGEYGARVTEQTEYIRCSVEDTERIRMSPRRTAATLRRLADRGYIAVKYDTTDGRRIPWVWINQDIIDKDTAVALQNRRNRRRKGGS